MNASSSPTSRQFNGTTTSPRPCRAVEDLDELVAVGQQDRDPVTLGQPQPGEQVGGPVGALVELGEGEPAAGRVVDERLQTRIQQGPLG